MQFGTATAPRPTKLRIRRDDRMPTKKPFWVQVFGQTREHVSLVLLEQEPRILQDTANTAKESVENEGNSHTLNRTHVRVCSK